MSVFSLEVKESNPVTSQTVDELCSLWGVAINDEEKKDYETLLAVFHDSADAMMKLPEYSPTVDLDRFPRQHVRLPNPEKNTLGAWAWKCEIIDQRGPNGDLSGKSVALKDNIAVKNVPMLMGTDMVKGYVPAIDATVVTRILEAGGRITGKAVCENLCHSATSSSAATGPVHNPYAKGYSSGGSSSGSGALVANHDVDLALGADQGGSVRVPAGWCGIYGLKPTFGLIPYTGCGSNEPTNDHLGPMSRTVLDNALLLQAIAGNDNIDDRSFATPSPSRIPRYHTRLLEIPNPTDLAGVRIGVLSEAFTQPALDSRVVECVRSAIAEFIRLGAIVEDVSIPMHTHGASIWTAVSKVGGYLAKQNLAFGRRGHAMNDLANLFTPLTQSSWDAAYVSTKNIYLNGAYAVKHFPSLLGHATNLSRQLRDAYDVALENYDVLVLPNLPYIATSNFDKEDKPLEKIRKQVGLTGNTASFNQSGHPVLAMPIGMLEIQEGPLKGSGVKLPVSMQVVGKWWGEERVYKVAYAWEKACNWKSR
ncbi:amidase signature enzyme [Pseudovirgaria hyperparasitica]|uniref:Amidase signature enzyme n=1 Tax=Pseudovirgaria hyperparasitica TaxID=470096 RepID=A0A6A6W3F4_9PEZI|nr:amidase signature enzyme [Pseudovirgaria hyperparasitica]KAF2756460.1 amidase signature enzyme [Pseudovirgaria hyperparasitica]